MKKYLLHGKLIAKPDAINELMRLAAETLLRQTVVIF